MFHGAGTTCISLALSHFLCNKQHKKTAYVELNTSDEIRFIKGGTQKDVCYHMGIALFPNASPSSLSAILERDFEYFILDMGVLNTYTIEQFSHCQKQFIVGSLNSWKRHKTLEKISQLTKNTMIHQDKVIFIRTPEEKESNFSLFSKPFAKIVDAPYIPNPFHISFDSFGFYETLLR